MAVSSQQIIDFLIANPNMSDAEIASVMNQFGVSPSDVAAATGADEATIQARFEEAAPVTSLLDAPVVAPIDEPPAAPVETVAAPTAPIAPIAPVVKAKTGTEQMVDLLIKNPNLTDVELVKAMETYKVSPADIAKATGSDEAKIVARVAATIPEGMSVTLGDTNIAPQYQVIGSGEDRQVGGIENIYTMKTTGDVNYKAPVGSEYKVLKPDGTFESTGTVKKDLSFFGGLADALNDPVIKTALMATGLPAGIGEAVGLGTGATATAVGTGLLNAGTTAATGADLKDVVKAGVIGGGASLLGSTVNDLISSGSAIDASGMTQGQFDASLEGQLVKDMQNAGLNNNQISAFLDDMGIGQGLTVPSTTTPTTGASTVPEVTVTAPATPAPPNLSGVINAISNTVPTVEIKSERPKDTATPTLLTPSATVPEVTVTGTKPVITAPTTPITPIVPTVPLVLPTIPPAPPTPPTPPAPPPDKTPSIADVLKVIGTVATIGGVANAVTPPKTTYPIVPIPTDWKPPTTQPTSPYQPLTPIDFGNQNLLKGTQWEKFLDPNYGKVPTPTMPTAPASNMSYSNLMDILGSKQGAPMPAGSLSINDIISGIQNQYGQTPQGSMGQKPA